MAKPRIPNQRKANLEHKKRVERYAMLIQEVYDKVAKEGARYAELSGARSDEAFQFEDYPMAKAAINRLLRDLVSDVRTIIMAGTSEEWKQSNLVQDLVARKVLTAYTGSNRFGEEFTRYFQTNPDSLKAFQERKDEGMNLSTRVWNLSEQYKTELEESITAAIAPGMPAMELAAQVKQYLKEPDKRFRRIKEKMEDGTIKWRLSNPAKAYHPGQGVYRSSARNAQRLARTEINMAYRTAEQERWKQFDFVVGYEVKTTQNGHHVEDICDRLAGKYPKDFVFKGWHPQCYSDDSEVLTDSGWKLFKDVTKSDRILSLNPDTRKPEWAGIADMQCYEHNGDMVRFFNKSLDCLVTPEHRMVYLNKSNGEIRYCQAKDYTKGKGAFYRGAIYQGEEKDFYEIEGKKIAFDDFCEFMGYYLSDGSLQHGTGVIIAQRNDQPAFDPIMNVVIRMGYSPKVCKDTIAIYNSSLNRYLSQFGVCIDKFIPEEIKTSSKRQIQIFLNAFIKCDGCSRKPKFFIGNHGNVFKTNKEERIFFTTSERLAGDLSELLLKVGSRPSFRKQEPKETIKKDGTIIKGNYQCYRISECYATTATVFNKESVVYRGKVYDLTLERNHIMYIRRNGKCFWGSNCMCYTIPILKTEDEFWALDDDKPSVNEVKDVPDNFKEWINDNKDRIEAAEERGKLPYFIRDNRENVENILNPKPKKTPQEIAAARHAERTSEDVARIQNAWDERKRQMEAQSKPIVDTNHNEVANALGIEPCEPMSFEQANEMRGNPNYKKGVKYRVNCQSSVLANELRRRGFDVEAYGNTKQDWYMPSVLAKKPEIAFMNVNGEPPVPKGISFNEDLRSSLEGEMKEVGRYHLRFRFANDGGHIITAERLADGSLRIYDPQSGKIIKDFSEYATKVKSESFEYYRVDNLQINPNVAKGAVKPSKTKGEAPRMQLPEIKEFLEKGWYGNGVRNRTREEIRDIQQRWNERKLSRSAQSGESSSLIVDPDRRVNAAISKREKLKFEKEYRMASTYATFGHKVEMVKEVPGISSPDAIIDGKKVDFKSLASANNIERHAKEAIYKQGADEVWFEFTCKNDKILSEINKIRERGIHGRYYFKDEQKEYIF